MGANIMEIKLRHLTDEALTMIARRFAVLGVPMRLHLLHALFEGERSVNTLIETTQGTQANVSRHLKVLLDAGLLTRRKKGVYIFYAIADPSIIEHCELACSSLERLHVMQAEAFARK